MISFFKEFWKYMRVRKKYWLLPVLIVSILLGVLIIVAESSVATPFMYSIF